MAYRINKANLTARVDALNKALDRPIAPYVIDLFERNAGDRYRAQIGNFHIGYSYNACQLHEMMNEHGGITTHGPAGTKREVYEYIGGLLDGIRMARHG